MYNVKFRESQLTSKVKEPKNGTDDTIVDCMKLNGNMDIQIMDCISGIKAI